MSSAARPAGVEVVSRVWPPAVLAVGLVVVWELAVRVANVPAFVLPAPSQVVAAGAELAPVLGAHVATTMTACTGVSAREAIVVAMMFDASWKPLV